MLSEPNSDLESVVEKNIYHNRHKGGIKSVYQVEWCDDLKKL